MGPSIQTLVGNDGIAFSANECARVTILAVAGGGRGDNGINEPNASVDPAGAGGKGGAFRVVDDIPIAELANQNHGISIGQGNGGTTHFPVMDMPIISE